MRQNPDNNTLPTPMRVGRLWLFPDGTTLPVVRGGDGDDDDDEGANDEPVKLTNKQLNDMLAERVRKAKGSATKDLLKTLGVEDLDAVKSMLEAHRSSQEQGKTELDKATQRASKAEQEGTTLKTQLADTVLTTRIEKALISEGMSVKAAERARRMIDLEHGASEEDIAAEVEALKKETPALFPTSQEGQGSEGDGSRRTPPPPPGRPPAQPKSQPSSQEKALSLLHERHPQTRKS